LCFYLQFMLVGRDDRQVYHKNSIALIGTEIIDT